MDGDICSLWKTPSKGVFLTKNHQQVLYSNCCTRLSENIKAKTLKNGDMADLCKNFEMLKNACIR